MRAPMPTPSITELSIPQENPRSVSTAFLILTLVPTCLAIPLPSRSRRSGDRKQPRITVGLRKPSGIVGCQVNTVALRRSQRRSHSCAAASDGRLGLYPQFRSDGSHNSLPNPEPCQNVGSRRVGGSGLAGTRITEDLVQAARAEALEIEGDVAISQRLEPIDQAHPDLGIEHARTLGERDLDPGNVAVMAQAQVAKPK